MHEACVPMARISIKGIGCAKTTPCSYFVTQTYRWDSIRSNEKMNGSTEVMEETVAKGMLGASLHAWLHLRITKSILSKKSMDA